MRLLQVNSVYNTGSTGRIVEGIAQAARSRGHSVLAAFGRREVPGSTPTVRIGERYDPWLHGLKSFFMDGHGLGSKKATTDFIAHIQKWDPDVIGLHNLHGYYLNLPILFRYFRERRKKLIWTLHDCWPFTGHCTYFDRFACERWKTGCYACPMTKYYPRSLIDRSDRNWDWKKRLFEGLSNLCIVTPSSWLGNLVRQSYLAEHETVVINNGVDLQVFKPGLDDPEEKLVLGVASVWDERKGLKDFYKLRQILSEEWDILLIGLSRKQMMNLPKGIDGMGRTENASALAEIYSKATVFVNPTYSENFPTTNLESLACGTPVISYRTGGSPESVTHSTGRLVDQGDVVGLADAAKELSGKPGVGMQRYCREHAMAQFSAADRFADYVRLAESL